ncbi:hypothetical protein PTKIN_Ptkin06aG0209000 [Pterospermum kingtungense]
MGLRAMLKLAVFLIVVFVCCHLVVEGRQIKSVSKNGSNQISKINDAAALLRKKDHQPAGPEAPSYIPNAAQYYSVSGKEEILPPPTPTKSKTPHFGDQLQGTQMIFGPVLHQGNSPGVGHSFAEGDEDVEQKPAGSNSSSNGKHSIAGDKDDFRPTNPGHRPGVGDHALRSKNSEPKA